MLTLIVGLALFLGAHSVRIVAPAWRDRMVQRLGAGGWKSVYSIVSIAGFLLIISGYAQARLEPVVLYVPPVGLRHLTALLMVPVFPLLLAAYLPGRIQSTVKHPMLAATKLWAFSHLLANGMLADLLLFGGLLAWAVVDRISVGKRPAAAPARVPAPGLRNDVIAVVAGLVLYVVFVKWAHLHLFGVPPIS